ncbi:MAG: hydrogenase expression/formation protein HypE [Phycisphaerae bacterium]
MTDTGRIELAHGGGGQLTCELIEQVILPAIGGQQPDNLLDAAVFETAGKVAFTTDTFVVRPLEFPGGDIGKLAVCGTVNDLAVAGAKPRALSLALVLREGLEIDLLRRILASAAAEARNAGVTIVTGDTKVVERDACDGMIINTAGVGEPLPGASLGFDRIRPGDRVLLSGPLGEHAIAVMSRREGLSFSADLVSDCGSIHRPAMALVERLGEGVRFMRDPTRGGLAATLTEIASSAGYDVEIEESAIPANPSAVSAAEMLGLDLLSAANEGKLVAVVDGEAADEAREVLAACEISAGAAVIGTVGGPGSMVEMVTRVGGRRVIQKPYGEELPRIC